MKLKYLIICLFLIGSDAVFAQLVTLKGTVVDKKNNLKLPGVSVKVGAEGTNTDKNGNFTLTAPLKTLTEKGINFSCVGYLSARLIYQPNHFYQVELVENNRQLNEVVIGAGDDIIKKAIKRIPQNYPDKPIVIKGILRTQVWRNQSDYFKSDAVIKAYIPPYGGSEETTVAVLQNHIDTIYDRTLKHIKHWSNYNVVAFENIAHDRYILNKILKKRKFDYWLVGKQVYNDHKVFVINITLKDTGRRYDKMDATLYIDTASYAFVAANIYIYNLVRIGLLTNNVLNYRVAYEQIGNKWYLTETHLIDSAAYKKQSPVSNVDFVRTAIDSVNVERIPYKDIVQTRDDILTIDKFTAKEEWARNDSLFAKAQSEARIAAVSNTLLDTIKKNNAITNPPGQPYKKPFGRRVFDYIAGDNIRATVGLTKPPVAITSPLYTVSPIVNYGLEAAANFRLYKNWFIGYQGYSNIRNSRHIALSTTAFNLSNDFVFNKTSRSITLTPFAGYEEIAVKYQNAEIDYNTFSYGLRVAYELNHKKALFVSFGSNLPPASSSFNGLVITPTHYSVGLGLVLKN